MFKKILAICSAAAATVLIMLPAGAWFGRPFGCGFGGLPFGISSAFSSFSSFTSFTSFSSSFSSFGGCGW